MENTKILSNEEYNGMALSIPDLIQEHVNLEEKIWYDAPVPALPAFEKPKKIPITAGFKNFIKSSVMMFMP